MDFNSLADLKQWVLPALRKKSSDFKRLGIDYSEEYIWLYLKQNKWMKSKNLSLNEIVNDILKITKEDLNWV